MKKRKKIAYFSLDLSNTFNELLMENIYKRSRYYDLDLFVINGGRLNSPEKREKESNYLYTLFNKNSFDGIILSNIFSFINEADAINFLHPFKDVPALVLVQEFASLPVIKVDNKSGFKKLLEHLIIEKKCKDIAVITGPAKNMDSIERFKTFSKTLNEYNIEINPDKIYHGTYSYDSGIDGVKELIDVRKQTFDALVCFNDNMAIAALTELKKHGIKIPLDLKVTGFDNTLESMYVNPSLSTVNYPMNELGIESVNLIYKMINGESIRHETVLTTSCIIRNSTNLKKKKHKIKNRLELLGDLNISEHLKSFSLKNMLSKEFKLNFINSCTPIIKKFLNKKENDWLHSSCELFFSNFIKIIDLDLKINLYDLFSTKVLLNYSYEWSYGFWNLFFNKTYSLLKEILPEKIFKKIKNTFKDLIKLSQKTYDNYYLQEKILERKSEEYLIEVGEDLTTAFDINSIGIHLHKKLEKLKITSCFIVIYLDEKKTQSKLLFAIDNGEYLNVNNFSNFNSSDLLPTGLMHKLSNLLMEALSIRNECFGHVLFNIGEDLGLIYKSLRHYISSCIKGSNLIDTINNYNFNLEEKLDKRTKEIKKINEQLSKEIEKRENVEKELIIKNNLDSLGLLAGGIAHDFNNILTGIIGNVSLLQHDFYEPEELSVYLDDILSAANNAANLTKQLLTFSKGGSPVKENKSITSLVEETSRFTLRGTPIKPEFKFSENLKDIYVDENQITQVLNNIIINAIHAMPQGGTIQFIAEMYSHTENNQFLCKGEYVKLSIVDNGSGINEKNLSKIFNPYYSTKSTGSGLGLATSLAILKKHGGNITVKSQLNKGTTFILYLPVSGETKPKKQEKPVYFKEKIFNILVLDDDIYVISILKKFLKLLGHNFKITNDGTETLEEFKKNINTKNKYDILILDLTIPGGLGGKEIINKILEIDPQAKAIVSSGYHDTPIMAEYKKYGFKALLPKPYTLNDLKKTLSKF